MSTSTRPSTARRPSFGERRLRDFLDHESPSSRGVSSHGRPARDEFAGRSRQLRVGMIVAFLALAIIVGCVLF